MHLSSKKCKIPRQTLGTEQLSPKIKFPSTSKKLAEKMQQWLPRKEISDKNDTASTTRISDNQIHLKEVLSRKFDPFLFSRRRLLRDGCVVLVYAAIGPHCQRLR